MKKNNRLVNGGTWCPPVDTSFSDSSLNKLNDLSESCSYLKLTYCSFHRKAHVYTSLLNSSPFVLWKNANVSC